MRDKLLTIVNALAKAATLKLKKVTVIPFEKNDTETYN